MSASSGLPAAAVPHPLALAVCRGHEASNIPGGPNAEVEKCIATITKQIWASSESLQVALSLYFQPLLIFIMRNVHSSPDIKAAAVALRQGVSEPLAAMLEQYRTACPALFKETDKHTPFAQQRFAEWDLFVRWAYAMRAAGTSGRDEEQHAIVFFNEVMNLMKQKAYLLDDLHQALLNYRKAVENASPARYEVHQQQTNHGSNARDVGAGASFVSRDRVGNSVQAGGGASGGAMNKQSGGVRAGQENMPIKPYQLYAMLAVMGVLATATVKTHATPLGLGGCKWPFGRK
jgi:hypothetical protein